MQENVSLKPYNTFGIEAQARYFFELNSLNDLATLKTQPLFNTNRLILGGGSNILLTKDFDGIVVQNLLKGIEIIQETAESVLIKANAGEEWHQFVLFCIKNNFGGIENLSLIPGKVGASPMQNIGAYGVEIKDVFHSLKAWNIEKEQLETFKINDCHFGYRESVFKNIHKGKYLICSVTYKLYKNIYKTNTSYGAIAQTLEENGITTPTIQDVSNAVISIRQSKLPNPKEIGNAGSFFKNPVVEKQQLDILLSKHNNLPYYQVSDKEYKLPAGWLIDQAGWKGKRFNNYGVHKNQALVLVNYGGAKGKDIVKLAKDIQADILEKYGVEISPEVNFI